MKDFIQVTVDKNSGKKGIINIHAIAFAEPFPNDEGATTLYLSAGAQSGGNFQVVVDEPLETIVKLIQQAQ